MAEGTLLVEAVPFRVQDAMVSPGRRVLFSFAAHQPRRLGTIQIAAFLEGAGTALWPLKRNLIINSSAALVLLISLTVVAFRLRSYVAGGRLETRG